MFSKIALSIFISFELSFYLLIAQTGIVEYLSSNIYAISPIAIGGIIGSILVYFIKLSSKNKIVLLLLLQFSVSLAYPDFSKVLLFLLGLSVGGLAPLIIEKIKESSTLQLAFALALSYTLGTALFIIEPSDRQFIAIIFSLVCLISVLFIKDNEKMKSLPSYSYSLYSMTLWVFIDSALFETLSRDASISIWRDGFTLEIIVFHIVGVLAAFTFKFEKFENEIFVILLFALSYLLFFLQEAALLGIVYPFVISYYNVAILRGIIKKDFRTICIYMIFIGWIASGLGLLVALENLILYVPIIFLISLLKVLSSYNISIKEKKCIN
ncbi:hypothetical protein [Arcobacter roscoffensis]|uniref:Uncharacterized protein n=1 Tax=Arcobacter roscoffensis TaxID=2961520 RepID=A0ABY5E313_9BACT|nr:hypothetical protein [Arcobacter roscoffensis]UTJ05111.1 hypothetical protein NJU99_07465 [Arcobacter roscoffensis]